MKAGKFMNILRTGPRQHLPTVSSSHPSTLRPFHILNFSSRRRKKITKKSTAIFLFHITSSANILYFFAYENSHPQRESETFEIFIRCVSNFPLYCVLYLHTVSFIILVLILLDILNASCISYL